MVAYEGSGPFVFVSYAHKDKNQVLPIVEGLQKRGFRVWYDKRGISAGSEWAEVIAEHLEKCRCVVAFVSRSFGASNNCREELNYAKELKKTILVVYLEDRNNLRGAVRMQLSTLHSLNLGDYAGTEAFIQEIAEEEALLPCRGVVAVPKQTNTVEQRRQAYTNEVKKEFLHSYFDNLSEAPAKPGPEELFNQPLALDEKKEDEKAALPYQKAAEQGNARAQYSMGWCYQHGRGVRKNKVEARKWYQKAADQGHEKAIEALKTL